MKPQNVLLMIADDWSPIAGCYGNPVVQTPHIDALAQRGTLFETAFCTTPSCAPSRANLLTGRYAHQHGQYGLSHGSHAFRTHEHLADRTLPACLNQAGILTGLVGKSHVEPHWVYPFKRIESKTASNQSLIAGVRQFLEEAGSQPFYLHVGSYYPHRTAGIFDRGLLREEFGSTDVIYDPAQVVVPAWMPDEPAVRQELADYYTYITRLDQSVGAMMAELERAGRAEDTTIILMSDHGMPFPAAKASPYEAGHHCPLIIARPGAQAVRSEALVNWTDLFPTICECLGLDQSALPQDLPGRSVASVLDQASPQGWEQTFYAHNFHGITDYYPYRVLRETRYKFVRSLAYQAPMPIPNALFFSPAWDIVRREKRTHMGCRPAEGIVHHEREALFDLQADPCETTNLIHRPELASVAQRMRQTLQAFREDTKDPWLAIDRQEAVE